MLGLNIGPVWEKFEPEIEIMGGSNGPFKKKCWQVEDEPHSNTLKQLGEIIFDGEFLLLSICVFAWYLKKH